MELALRMTALLKNFVRFRAHSALILHCFFALRQKLCIYSNLLVMSALLNRMNLCSSWFNKLNKYRTATVGNPVF
ncbi:uncharacterized protein PHALS_14509 [Plasmopara halstedii]|uniref:Uncharacterized protein n=1 Tax=Plasmopara halstedii TaxID=4781 RepID=A0A0N7L5D6_PLAHL|nr:uncharacterized protein PHALS_14509 [Plasmopara halstedii]CEG41179.1 hypothetical protein PHALS_14509 [Plasmopara halstedii]|eukprot:XP_024577548.1 hypothetical protein PHALS_14509 [Plasmopara halstedii]